MTVLTASTCFECPPPCSLFDASGTRSPRQGKQERADRTHPMPSKNNHEDGVKGKGRSKSDKARRSFELNGQYSSKHLRLKESAREAKCLQAREVK